MRHVGGSDGYHLGTVRRGAQELQRQLAFRNVIENTETAADNQFAFACGIPGQTKSRTEVGSVGAVSGTADARIAGEH